MLALVDPRWYELRAVSPHISPDEFLPLLRELRDNPTSAPWVIAEFSDKGYVCDQMAVAETTLAVVPHFIDAASKLPPIKRTGLLSLAGWYALLLGVPARAIGGVDPPVWLVADYHQAVQEALPLTGESLAAPPAGNDPEGDQLKLMAALAAFHGRRIAWVLVRTVMEWGSCPACGEEFNILDDWGRDL
jgi:hypothetical protein